jgi:hypothetical protein
MSVPVSVHQPAPGRTLAVWLEMFLAPVIYHLDTVAQRHAAAGSHPQVTGKGKGRRAAERDRQRPATLAENDDLVVQVEVAGEHDPGRLRDPHPGVQEQPQDGRVPPVGGSSGICGGFIPAMGLASSSPSATAHLKNAWRLRCRLSAVERRAGHDGVRGRSLKGGLVGSELRR